jgi:serine/threonine-protein kinase
MRLTSGAAFDHRPVWTPDGRRIVFASSRVDNLTTNLYWQRADGTGDAERLTSSTNPQQPSSWHPSGRFLAFEETTAQTKADIMILPFESDDAGSAPGTAYAFSDSPHAEFDPSFSPDGRWLAYSSLESGHPEVYVRPFPGPGGRWLIGAGANPTWSRTKRELLYGVDGLIMVATFSLDGDSFRAGRPRLWSERRYETRGSTRMFDLHPDGEHFALAPRAQPASTTVQDRLVFIFNFVNAQGRIAARTTR